MRTLLFLLCVLGHSGSACADDADDFAEVLRWDERLRASIPPSRTVIAAEFGSGAILLLRDEQGRRQEASIQSGSDWVELKPSSHIGTPCPDAGIPLARFTLASGIRAYFKARVIAAELGAKAVSPDAITLAHEAPACVPGWRITLIRESHYVYLRFDLDGTLVHLSDNAAGHRSELDSAALRAMDIRASAAVPSLRVEAEPLPPEAEILDVDTEEFLIATVDGNAYVCAQSDIHLVYDYYNLDLRCEGEATRDPLVLRVPAVRPGESAHRITPGEPGPTLWLRRGLVDLESDSSLPDIWIRIDALADHLVEGRFEGTVSNATGKQIRIASGRFRLLPGDGFSVSPP